MISALWAVIVVTGCDSAGNGPSAPPAQRLAPAYATGCSNECLIVIDDSPLLRVNGHGDSLDARVDLGNSVIVGTAGSMVTLTLDAESAWVHGLARQPEVIVRSNGIESRHSLRALLDGAVVFRFLRSDTLHVQYSITRGEGARSADHFRIRQRIIGEARVLSSRIPWNAAATVRASSVASLTANCVVAAAFSNVCGVDVTVNPYAPAENWGATFQSTPGNSTQSDITVTFSKAVRSVTVMIYDPTYAGNSMAAFDSTGAQIGSATFSYSGQPGTNIPDTKTVSAPGIRRVDLLHPITDYSAYDLSFALDSPPTSDPILNSPDVRTGFADALAHSDPSATPGTGVKKERGGFIWQEPNGGRIYTQEIVDPNATECSYTPQPLPSPPDRR